MTVSVRAGDRRDRRERVAATAAPARRRWLPAVPVEVLVLGALAAVTRFAGLTSPNAIVFDEVYFREYALRYATGSYYFDLHPPLGKLLLAGWAWLWGVRVDPTSSDPAVALRVLPALAGCALVLVVYQLLRELSASRKVATFAAALVLLDNAILVESRLTLVDSMLLLFGVGAVTCYLAARRASGRQHWLLVGAAAALGGMAVATKWTGLACLGVIGVLWLVDVLRSRRDGRRLIGPAAMLVVVPALVYVTVFAIHFAMLPNSGPGDAFMTDKFQATLAGNSHYDPAATDSFVDKFVELNQAIPNYENSLNTSVHPYSSTWLSWPLMKRPVYYWNGQTGDPGVQQYLYLQGNPAVWWGVLAGVVVIAAAWIRRPERFAPIAPSVAILGLAWAANFLPFATIVRPMFLYHYFFALIFCIGAVSLGLGRLAGWDDDGPDGGGQGAAWRFPSRGSLSLYAGLLAVVAGTFLWFVPISYGLPLDAGGLAGRIWLDTWR